MTAFVRKLTTPVDLHNTPVVFFSSMSTKPLKALQRAIDDAGSQVELARRIATPALPIKQQHIWNWLNRDKEVPAEAVIPIEKATDGRITRHELRPDLYPREQAAA